MDHIDGPLTPEGTRKAIVDACITVTRIDLARGPFDQKCPSRRSRGTFQPLNHVAKRHCVGFVWYVVRTSGDLVSRSLTLLLSVIRADRLDIQRRLLTKPSAYVKIQLQGVSLRTKVVRQTIKPAWEDKFTL
jgi:hypothetical protein